MSLTMIDGWFIVSYLIAALVVTAIAIDDIDDLEDVGNSTLVGLGWPLAVLLALYWYLMVWLVTFRDYVKSKLKEQNNDT